MRVRIIKNWNEPDLMRQTPGGLGVWRDFEFTLLDDGRKVDWVLALNNRFDASISVSAPPDRMAVLMQEPFVPGFTDWMDRGLQPYDVVFSSHRPSRCSRWERCQPATAWHVGRSLDELRSTQSPVKNRLMSWICGSARALPGHRDRLDFLVRVRREFGATIDLFGRAVVPIKDKWDGLAHHAFSLAIENTVCTDYWTEKVADCFLAWTCPIYHGAPNLQDYFPAEAFIRIDIRRPREAVEIIRGALAEGERGWERRLEAIAEARERVLERWQLFPAMSERLRSIARPCSTARPVIIPAYRGTISSSLRRRAQRWRGAIARLSRRN